MMSSKQLAEELKALSQGSEVYEQKCAELYRSFGRGGNAESLLQLVFGPVWDGDVISKSSRDELLSYGLASRACVRGEQGFTVATYLGWDVLSAGFPGWKEHAAKFDHRKKPVSA